MRHEKSGEDERKPNYRSLLGTAVVVIVLLTCVVWLLFAPGDSAP